VQALGQLFAANVAFTAELRRQDMAETEQM
jgi:hypothetical protein